MSKCIVCEADDSTVPLFSTQQGLVQPRDWKCLACIREGGVPEEQPSPYLVGLANRMVRGYNEKTVEN